jgi:GTP-binding protein EngB required for normal cell division
MVKKILSYFDGWLDQGRRGHVTILNQKKVPLIERLSKLKALTQGDSYLEQECEYIESRLHSEKYNIVVVGHFSTGKSTFMNALMGGYLLPTSVKETTAVTTRVFSVYEDDPRLDKASVAFKSGKVEWIDLHEYPHALKKYVTLLQDQIDVAAEIEVVDVYRSIPQLGESICLVDTPGDNGMAERIFESTKKEIEKATAIIYLMPDRGVSATDAKLLKYITQFQDRVFFVVNRMDAVEEEERESHLKSIAKRIETMGVMKLPPVMFGLSSKNALKGRIEKDELLVSKSQFPVFESALFQYIDKLEYVRDLFDSVEKDLERLEEEIEQMNNQRKEQNLQQEQKRKQVEARIDNIVRRMRLEYDQLEQGLLSYMRNETDQIITMLNEKKDTWVEFVAPSFESQALLLTKKVKGQLMDLLNKDWKDINLFVRGIKYQLNGLNGEINVLASEKYAEFIGKIHSDTLVLESYIPKRNREVIELIMQANHQKITSEKTFSRLVNELIQRQFHFQVNHEESQLDKKLQPVFKLEEEKKSLIVQSKLVEQDLAHLSEKLQLTEHEEKREKLRFEREKSRLGMMPKVETYYYDEDVPRKGLGKFLDLFSTKTVRKSGRDDSRQHQWIKDKQALENEYHSKIDNLSNGIGQLKQMRNEQALARKQYDRQASMLEMESEKQIIELMEDLQTSYLAYAKKCTAEFEMILQLQSTEVHKASTDDVMTDRKDVNEIIKMHVRERVKAEEAEIRHQHAYLFEGVL